ncbi:Chanoclavine-I aldehyde reductase fgaOx3 [Erysiphe necator]|uniref:Putative nadh oxidase family protein n=1 Tax=Uncinula necator TaxID=52586 RepID=A0A0B1P4F5_UNCNE|nr:Chanoclavine-I aldehyde reductase fgaOx3 [Erysiphe necator]KHJ33582.1 putative nadh oxidase family protein [Erysiphe necator]
MTTSNLFKPLQIGNLKLQNRLVMAPLTRFRADAKHVPLPFVSEYYVQRSSSPGTLLISEATIIAPEAGGYDNVPGIWSKDQIDSWKNVTKAVHDKECFIFLQLWALGRVGSLEVLKKELGENAKLVGPSKIGVSGGPSPTPLTEEEIQNYIGFYAQAAKNAIEAGFDGVEIHAAHGYLIDQFTQEVSNDRTDSWGGSIEKRAKFAIEVTKAVVEAIGAEKTGIRISPFSNFQGMGVKEPKPLFSYLVQELKKLNITYLHAVCSRVSGIIDQEEGEKLDFLINIWGDQNPFLIAGGFTPASAMEASDQEYPDKNLAVVFGRYFISNPDLVFRIRHGIDLTPYDRSTFYLPEQKNGYITYPYSKEYQAQLDKDINSNDTGKL